jgi:hypothetical protein
MGGGLGAAANEKRKKARKTGLCVRKANDLRPNVLCTVMAMEIAADLPAFV